MRAKQSLHSYQQDAIDYIYEHDRALALLPVGAGKTALAWTAITELMDDGHVDCPLVMAPLRVSQFVWSQERSQWAHLDGRPVVMWAGEPSGWPDSLWKTSRQLWGSRTHAEQRLPGIVDVRKKRDLETRLAGLIAEERTVNKEIRRTQPPRATHITSYENLLWICELYEPGKMPFDFLVLDEVGKLKNPKSPRYKAIRKHTAEIKMVLGMNATPAPEGFLDLFAQVQIVDGPRLWGKSFSQWRQKYFAPTDYMGFDWRLQIGAKDLLIKDLNTVAFRVDEAQLSYAKTMTHNQIVVELPPKARELYKSMSKTMSLSLEGNNLDPEEVDIIAMSAAAASMKLRQLTSGFIYDEDGVGHIVHEEKQHALSDLIDSMGREPLIVSYQFAEDLEAIRRVWKNVPYLGAGASSVAAGSAIERWNKREIPVLALHPACLHPNTLVLTEYVGWKKLIDVRADERVFDGVEFVTHKGCQLSGMRSVIETCGIVMTPDHLVLVDDKWVKAEDVRGSKTARRKARYAYTGDDARLGALLAMRPRKENDSAERSEEQQRKENALSGMLERRVPLHDRDTALEDVERYAGPHRKPEHCELQTLRGARDNGRPPLAKLQEFLGRYAGWLRRRSDDRAERRERKLLQSELPLGYEHGTAGQQTEQPFGHLPGAGNAPGRVLSGSRRHQRRYTTLPEQTRNGGRSDGCLPKVVVPSVAREPGWVQDAQEVYDLVDCGPRHRFVVRNDAGEMFIVHNSAGHGINLQAGGSHICWYTLPWDLEGFVQTNGRVDRQGQTRACYAHHIVAVDTIDQRVSEALAFKDAEQADIIAAIRSV